jgi:adhesin transport system outer membrane protein
MKRFIFVLLLLPMALAGQTYKLEDLVNYGLEHSWDMQKSELGLESSRSAYRSSKWNLLPDVSVFAGIDQDLTDNSAPRSSLSSSAGFSVSKTISLNDAAYFQYRYARLDRETAELEYSSARRKYAYDVVNAYFNVLSSQKRLASLTENLNIQTRVLEHSRVLFELGRNTNFDVKQSEIAVMSSQVAIIQLQNTIETARRSLFDLIQKADEGYPLEDIGLSDEYTVPAVDPEQIESIRMLKQSIKRNDIGLLQSKLDYFPNLSLAYNFRRSVGGDDFDFDTYSTVHGLSLNLSYSLWSPFRNKESYSRNRINNQMAELNLNSSITGINSQYQRLNSQLGYLQRLDELYLEQLEQSRQQISIAEERYRLGLIELLELDKTRTAYIDADINYSANRYQILQVREELNYLLSQRILGIW